MHVIGTAGHVDHGKSTLVKALTGIDPDRLREEQERQMTIDLGFAWLTLPSGEEIGIVDVPGHRDFIDNMLAGVGGLDAAMLVVAADEGVMPQTREHLAILDLLGIGQGIVALSKIDLIEDRQWLDMVQEELIELMHATSLEGAPILPVSAITGEGLEQVKAALVQVMARAAWRRDIGRPRLPIDRAFSIAGFGTVVTGTLLDGTLRVGQEVEILPQRIGGRIRGLQTHKHSVDVAVPGSRVAANISGVAAKQIQRGDVLGLPGMLESTSICDVHFKLLPDAGAPIRHNQSAKLFAGAAQRMARIRLLQANELQPGQDGWLQLDMRQPVVISRGDRFILRRPSPSTTLGGGVVADPHPKRRHKRRDPQVAHRLSALLSEKPSEVLLQSLAQLGPCTLSQAIGAAGLDPATGLAAAEELLRSGELLLLTGTLDTDPQVIDRGEWARHSQAVVGELEKYHQANPLRNGFPKEELRSKLNLGPATFGALLGGLLTQHLVEQDTRWLRLPGFTPHLSEQQTAAVEQLLARFKAHPQRPPSWKECLKSIGEQPCYYLLDSGRLIRLSEEVVLLPATYHELVDRVQQELASRGELTVAQVRDLFGTTRKYALALMEHLDEQGITRREGDSRKLIRT